VELLPPAWQHPEIATARILLDGRAHTTPDFKKGLHRQAADILVGGARRGGVEVFYTRDKAGFVEGPFLKEEQSLIDTVAREVSLVVERREAEISKSKLQDQLRHADRLATIGQLAAGMAHEVNEPLASILGFAQLANKEPGMPTTAASDLGKIIKTSLQAREIIHKLLVFSRQMPLQKMPVNLNQVVMARIVEAVSQGQAIEDLLWRDSRTHTRIRKQSDIPFYQAQRRKLLARNELDLLTVDGAGGGTGMSPWRMMNEWGIPPVERNKPQGEPVPKASRVNDDTPGTTLPIGSDQTAAGPKPIGHPRDTKRKSSVGPATVQ
jgi:signal transduction histidine kinase